ncbi:MAG: RloB family protein [Proteocatella sp.]
MGKKINWGKKNMGISERKGGKKDRDKKNIRIPYLGYYLIVTDTKETEKNYFEGIRDRLPSDLHGKLVIKVENEIATNRLVEVAKNYQSKEAQYMKPWIVFDKDLVTDFDDIIQMAEANNIEVAWSNPCIEVWFYAYFDNAPVMTDSVTCCSKFGEKFKKMTGQKYEKADPDILKKLIEYGNENMAIKRSEKKMSNFYADKICAPSEMYSGNKVYQLVKELIEKG